MIDFKIPDETKAIRDKVRNFVQSECHPAEENCTAENFDEVLAGLNPSEIRDVIPVIRAIRDQAKAADAAVSARRRSAVQQRRRSVYG